MRDKERDQMKKWEQDLDRRLKELPELRAPSSIATNVMRRIAERERSAWYSRSWKFWPRGLKISGVAVAVGIAVLAFFAGGRVDWMSLLNDIVILNTGGFSLYLAGVVGLWAALMFLYASSPAISGDYARSMTPKAVVHAVPSGSSEAAGNLPRFGALVLDFLIVSTCIGVKNTITTLSYVDLDYYFLILWAIYHLGFWAWKGATLGDIALRLRVERLDGERLTIGDCVIRGLAALVSALPLGLGFWWASWDGQGQSWHDKASGTVIEQTPKRRPML